MSIKLHCQMMSYVRQSLESVHFYRGCAKRHPKNAAYYTSQARRALKEARYWQEWAREELGCEEPTQRAHIWDAVRTPRQDAVPFIMGDA